MHLHRWFSYGGTIACGCGGRERLKALRVPCRRASRNGADCLRPFPSTRATDLRTSSRQRQRVPDDDLLRHEAVYGRGSAGRAVAKPSLIVPPAACTAKVGRVRPGGEPWVISQLRWETITYNRDRLTDARIAWAADINARNSAPEDQIQ